jgi:hypothetical protein
MLQSSLILDLIPLSHQTSNLPLFSSFRERESFSDHWNLLGPGWINLCDRELAELAYLGNNLPILLAACWHTSDS